MWPLCITLLVKLWSTGFQIFFCNWWLSSLCKLTSRLLPSVPYVRSLLTPFNTYALSLIFSLCLTTRFSHVFPALDIINWYTLDLLLVARFKSILPSEDSLSRVCNFCSLLLCTLHNCHGMLNKRAVSVPGDKRLSVFLSLKFTWSVFNHLDVCGITNQLLLPFGKPTM